MAFKIRCSKCGESYIEPSIGSANHICLPRTMVKCFYFPVDSQEHGNALAKFLSQLCGLHFIHQDAVPGTLEEVKQILQESNVLTTLKIEIL